MAVMKEGIRLTNAHMRHEPGRNHKIGDWESLKKKMESVSHNGRDDIENIKYFIVPL